MNSSVAAVEAAQIVGVTGEGTEWKRNSFIMWLPVHSAAESWLQGTYCFLHLKNGEEELKRIERKETRVTKGTMKGMIRQGRPLQAGKEAVGAKIWERSVKSQRGQKAWT